MKQLSSLPDWCLLQQQPLARAPKSVKILCSGKGVKYFARRGTGTNREIVVWNSRSSWKITPADLA